MRRTYTSPNRCSPDGFPLNRSAPNDLLDRFVSPANLGFYVEYGVQHILKRCPS